MLFYPRHVTTASASWLLPADGIRPRATFAAGHAHSDVVLSSRAFHQHTAAPSLFSQTQLVHPSLFESGPSGVFHLAIPTTVSSSHLDAS